MFNKKFITILSIIIGVIVVGTMVVVLVDLARNESNSKIIQEDESNIDISDWQIYQNEEYGFEFRYPEKFGITANLDIDYLRTNANSGEYSFSIYDKNSGDHFSSVWFYRKGVGFGRGNYIPEIAGYRKTVANIVEIALDDEWMKVIPLKTIETELGKVIIVNGSVANIDDKFFAIGNLANYKLFDGFYFSWPKNNQYVTEDTFFKILSTISN